jgi:4-hydroxyphenylpyruvate dioxygenase
MAWSRRVRDYAHGWEVVRVSGHPNVGLCIDTFHTFMRADPLDTLPAIPAEKLFLVQANDALRIDLDVIEISRHHRALPGRGYFRLPEFMRALGRTSYDGPLSLEIFSDVLRALPPGQSAAECMRGYRWLRGLLPAR